MKTRMFWRVCSNDYRKKVDDTELDTVTETERYRA